MVDREDVLKVLSGVAHPETGVDVATAGMVADVTVGDSDITVTIKPLRPHDPFINSLLRRCGEVLEEAFPEYRGKVETGMDQAVAVTAPQSPNHIKYTVAVASGKGGVGKSTVACNLAVTLARMGYAVGLLDADIYGPSQPMMFDVAGYSPEAHRVGELEMMVPAESHGVKLMSIGFFVSPSDALVWRGAMATNALRQMVAQTLWGELDFLLIDLPPGTGDIHLTIVQEIKLDGVVIVTTPQAVAQADVVRGIEMFRSKKIGVPVLGLVENMAWFTPVELPDNKYYIFGRGGVETLVKEKELELIGQIPVIQSIAESGDRGRPAVETNSIVMGQFITTAGKIVDKLQKSVERL